jgi:ferredoxin
MPPGVDHRPTTGRDGSEDTHMTEDPSDGSDDEFEEPDERPGPEVDGELPSPRPDRSPEDVLKTVLSALSTNDDPAEDAGIVTAFNLSTPRFRSMAGGSLAAFRDYLTDPINGTLVDHDTAKRGKLDVEDGTATEKVVVTGSDGDTVTYSVTLEELEGGKYDGCWMVDGIDLVYPGESPDHQHMPVVEFGGTEVKCKESDTLRDVLLRASGLSPYNSTAKYANCNGNGLCGTCAVEVHGEVTEKSAQEKRRLKLPPHRNNDDPTFRLSCQCRVLGDLEVHKHDGMWGQHVEEYAAGTEEDPDSAPIRVSDEEYEGGADEDEEDDREADGEMDLSENARAMLDDAADRLDE